MMPWWSHLLFATLGVIVGHVIARWVVRRKMRRMDHLFEPLVQVKSCESCDIARGDGSQCELELCCKYSEYDPWRYWIMKRGER